MSTATRPTVDGDEELVTESPARDHGVSGRRVAGNTMVNGLANVWSALITLALTPFLLTHLGRSGYGLWVLALGLTFTSGYLALADLGLTEASVKYVAEADARNDVEAMNRVASSTLVVFVVLGLLLGGTMWLTAPILVSWFSIPASLHEAAVLLFRLMGLEVLVELPTTALRAVIEGHQRYGWLRLIDIVGRVVWAGLIITVIAGGHGVVALATVTLAVAAARGLAAYAVAHRVAPGLRLRPHFVSRATLREVIALGSMVSGLRVLTVVYAQMDRMIIAAVLTVASVASYEVAFRMQSIATLVLVTASSAIVPAAAYNAMRGDQRRQRELYVRGTKYAMVMTLPVCIAGLLYARALMVGWVGETFSGDATAARLFLIFPLFASINQVGIAMMIGLGRVRRVLLYQVIGVGTNLALSIVLARPWGIRGVVAGTLIGGMVVWAPYLRLLLRTFDVRIGQLVRVAVVPVMIPAMIQIGVGLLTLPLVAQSSSLLVAGMWFATSCALFGAATMVFGLSRDERESVRNWMPWPRAA